MTQVEECRARVNQIETLAAKHDELDPNADDMDFTPGNPWLPLLTAARRGLLEAIQAEQQHGPLIVKPLS